MQREITNEQARIMCREILAAIETDNIKGAKQMLRETLAWLEKIEAARV